MLAALKTDVSTAIRCFCERMHKRVILPLPANLDAAAHWRARAGVGRESHQLPRTSTSLSRLALPRAGECLSMGLGTPGALGRDSMMQKPTRYLRFPAEARKVYDAIVEQGVAGSVFELAGDGMHLACHSWPHPAPPGQYWIVMDGMLTLDQETASRHGLACSGLPVGLADVQPPHLEPVVVCLIIQQMEPDNCEVVLEITPYSRQPHKESGYLAGTAISSARLSSILGIVESLLRTWAAQHPAFVNRPPDKQLDPSGSLVLPEATPSELERTRMVQIYPAGRPPEADDDWAYEQVVVLGHRLGEVYPLWLQRISVERRQGLVNPYDAFLKAIRRRRRKEDPDQ